MLSDPSKLCPVRHRRVSSLIVALLSLACLSSDSQALTFYPDVMGDTVWFRNISENTKSAGDPEPLYGMPTALVDTLDFNPNNYNFVASSNTNLVDSTDGALSLMIEAKPGYVLDTVCLDESGLVNLFTINGDPYASVTGLVELTINAVDNVLLPPINLPGIMPAFSPSGGTFLHSQDAGGVPQYSSAWQGSAKINLFDELDNGQIDYEFGVTKVTLRIDNFLLAAAGGEGSQASIDKKEFMITTETNPIIPEPATLGLALMGLFGAMQMRHRQRSLVC
jgi:hypothetical protein